MAKTKTASTEPEPVAPVDPPHDDQPPAAEPEPEVSLAPKLHDLKAPEGTCSVGVGDLTVLVPKSGVLRGVSEDVASELIRNHGFTVVGE